MKQGALRICVWACLVPAVVEAGSELRVVTFNTWHGLTPRGVLRLQGEEPSRGAARRAVQLAELAELAADVVFLQELNPAPAAARRYARELGYEEIHQVDSCGIKLGSIGIPTNVRAGLAILARPELSLRRLGARRLSGACGCRDRFGFQLAETRYALLGTIVVGGHEVLLVNVHLHHVPFVDAPLDSGLERLREAGALSEAERRKVVRRLERHRRRQRREVAKLLRSIAATAARGGYETVVVAGDFNAAPDSAVARAMRTAGFRYAGEGMAPPPPPTVDPRVNPQQPAPRPRLPSFSRPELLELYARLAERPRWIDHVFFRGALRLTAVERVLDRPQGGLYASDHFGLLAAFELATAPGGHSD